MIVPPMEVDGNEVKNQALAVQVRHRVGWHGFGKCACGGPKGRQAEVLQSVYAVVAVAGEFL